MLPPKIRDWMRFSFRWIKRTVFALLAFSIGYAALAWILGRIPVNRDFHHALGENAIEILLVNNGVHVDLVLPLDHPKHSLRNYLSSDDFAAVASHYSYGVFGWGNRKFYLETPSWDQLNLSTVAYSLAGLGDTTVHVNLTPDLEWPLENSRMLKLSEEQFARLVQHIVSTMERSATGQGVAIPGAHYHSTDAFYRGLGNYHLFRTCNVWVGEGLKKAGVRVGVWTVTPQSLFASLPADSRTATKHRGAGPLHSR